MGGSGVRQGGCPVRRGLNLQIVSDDSLRCEVILLKPYLSGSQPLYCFHSERYSTALELCREGLSALRSQS